MRRLTDFQIAALSAVASFVGGFGASAVDIWWAFQEMAINAHSHLPIVIKGLGFTLIFFVLSAILLVWSLIRHRDTDKKPVQSKDDIDYRISLAFRKAGICKLKAKEKAVRNKFK
jgi:hypothetical protein